MTDLVVRPLVAGEEELFLSLVEPALVGIQSTGRDYRELTKLGQYRPEWTWVALRGERVVARAAWWAGPDDDKPIALDWLDFDDGESAAAVEILATAGFDAEYCLVLPPHWRDDPAARKAGEGRVEVARRAGMRLFVERLRYTWTPADGLPDRPGRLRFEPEPDDDRVFDVLRRIAHGSLDAHERRAMAEGGADAAAREEMEFLNWLPSPRSWLRFAYTVDGELAGLTVPGRNHHSPTIGLVGVVPEQRGNGYAYDLLVEATHLLVAEGAEQVTAETDTTNTPMAATFARAGYPITQERIYLQHPFRRQL
jgi:ribosomal protein S18 acetylase RimI-like enzyme